MTVLDEIQASIKQLAETAGPSVVGIGQRWGIGSGIVLAEGLSGSEEAFADELAVHRTYMGGIERGERNLTLKSLERIAERLGLDPLSLLQPTDAPSRR